MDKMTDNQKSSPEDEFGACQITAVDVKLAGPGLSDKRKNVPNGVLFALLSLSGQNSLLTG